jgi:uncharacterized protein (DUF885 family)
MRRAIFLAALLAALTPVLDVAAAEPPRSEALHAFFDRRFQEQLKEAPELATFVGANLANDRWSDLSPAATERRKAMRRKALSELLRFDPRKLNTQDRISREVMLDSLRRQEAYDGFFRDLPFGSDGPDGWLLFSPMFGLHDRLLFVAKASPFANARDYGNYLKRLAALPAVLEAATARLRTAQRAGWMPPKVVMATVPGRLAPFAEGEPAASPFFFAFRSFPPAIPEPERARLAEAARAVIAGELQPAFAKLRRFLESEYIPAAREGISASGLPAGAAYYAHAVAQQTTTALTPQAIHETGLREVARIRGEMEKAIASAGFQGSSAEFARFLKADPQFHYTSSEEILRAYRDIAKRADAELPKLFAELPRLPYGIRPMEAHEGDNADHYSPGALDGSRAGIFEANTNNPAKRPKYDMEATLLHEAVPGHHLQIARSQELKDLPAFRRTGGYTAYSEGWALYAESLGYEMGFYKDPYSRFGALSAEMLRACRLVVDTGMHALGWERERAIRYLVDNAGVHEGFATAEIDRYIVWPGQALGYKVGELKIKELRARAQKALGERFDLRRFHNALLDDGALPLNLLEARIGEWIAQEASRPATRRSP